MVSIFPNEEAIVRLIGAILLEQNDECAIRRARYMTLETIAPLSDDPAIRLPGNRQLTRPAGERGDSPPAQDTIMATCMVTHYGAFFAEVPIRPKLGGHPSPFKNNGYFRRGVEGGPYLHQDASDVKRTSANERGARPGSSFQSFLLAPLAAMPTSIKPPRSTWLVSSLLALPHDEIWLTLEHGIPF